jgi:pyruvate dehydrogenase kinase 2/3/4
MPIHMFLICANRPTFTCINHSRPAPEIEFIATDSTVTTTHIEEHLHSILYELLKKSIRTTMQHSLAHSSLPDPSSSRRSLLSSFISSLAPSQSTAGVPPISILIAQGAQDITIKISDRGGGMPMSAMNDSWSYFVYDKAEEAHGEEKVHAERPFGSGVGMSLPAARVIARCKY